MSAVPIVDLLQLQYRVIPTDRPVIEYQIPDNTYAPLANVSVGQKCTAMLIMALSEGSMPILIDQPEDSLDIKTVWTDVCSKLRKGKEHRQFIFTTHNSSLAVASDSDSFVVVAADADKGRVEYVGSMDHEPMGGEVLKYMEGGIETYQKKYAKYNVKRKLTVGR